MVLSASDRPVAVRSAMRAGARGYALKSEQADQIRAAIREVAAGRDWISPRLAYILATDDAADRPALSKQERRALQLYATGMPMKSVARKMSISEETAKQYMGRVREKYARAGRAAPTKLELYYRAVEDGHVPPTSLVHAPRRISSKDTPVPGPSCVNNLSTLHRVVMTPIPGSAPPGNFDHYRRNWGTGDSFPELLVTSVSCVTRRALVGIDAIAMSVGWAGYHGRSRWGHGEPSRLDPGVHPG